MNILNRFTLRSLSKNKTRTIVTIIGIALSVSMFTAVASIIVSFQDYMLQMEIATKGAWEGKMENCSPNIVKKVEQDSEVKGYTKAAELGYAELEGCSNADKPYLFVLGIGKDFTDFSPIHLVEGRMPENNTELVIPKHLEVNGGVKYKVGDTLRLQLGKRVCKEGENKGQLIGGQNVSFSSSESSEGNETLADTVSKTYKVVGVCERPVYEGYSAPGYTAFSLDNEAETDSYDMMMTFRDPKKSSDLLEQYIQLDGEDVAMRIFYDVHGSLLRYEGKSTNDGYNSVLYSMGAILMAVIAIGSISLIYNAFSISVSERTRQFGLLKSIGATKKQMRQSVLFEAFILSLAGIPLGLAAGLGGIGITFHYVDGLIQHLWSAERRADVTLTLVITWQSMVLAVLISLITVLVSALIPARKAVKLSAIQAIRQNGEVRIRPEKVRTSRLTSFLFGFEGMLASKNFKRNRKKHRTTVFSLFISIVLFITATSFSGYLKSTQDVFGRPGSYDITFGLNGDSIGSHTVDEVAREVEDIPGVKKAGYSKMAGAMIEVPEKYLSEDYLKLRESQGESRNGQPVSLDAVIFFVRDDIYRDYLEKNGLDADACMDPENWTPLVMDRANTYIDDKVFTAHILRETGWEGVLTMVREQPGYYFLEKQGDVCIFEEDSWEEEPKKKKFPAEKVCYEKKAALGHRQDGELPLGVDDLRWQQSLTLLLPYSAIEKNRLPEDITYMNSTQYTIQAPDHQEVYTQLSRYLSDASFGSGASDSLFDVAESREADRALILVIDIFSYGFIVLISLISIANVFNTISTNVQLRRQEFAMLKSVGMTGKGFDRMMNYECALYGIKALFMGIPVSLVVSWLMYRSMGRGWNAGYMLPWQGILIVMVSVFVIVFATMLYAMSKIKKDNPIEALRNENL